MVENEINKLNYIRNVFIKSEYDYFSEKHQLYCNLIIDKTDNKKNEEILKELYFYLLDIFPKYYIPIYFKIYKEFDYLPNGKINKKIDPKKISSYKNINEILFSTAKNKYKNLQELILWNFNIKIAKNDNLFDYGFNSLNILLLANIISDYYLIKMTPSIIYKNPTVKDILTIINIKQNNDKLVKIHHSNYYYERPNLLSNILFVFFCGRMHKIDGIDFDVLVNTYNINYIKFMDKSLNFHLNTNWKDILSEIKIRHNYNFLIAVSNSMGGLIHVLNLNLFDYNFISAPVCIENCGRLQKSLGPRKSTLIERIKNINLNNETYFLYSKNNKLDCVSINNYFRYLTTKYLSNKEKIFILTSDYNSYKHGYFNYRTCELNMFSKPIKLLKSINKKKLNYNIYKKYEYIVDYGTGGKFFSNINNKFINICSQKSVLNKDFLENEISKIDPKSSILLGSFTLSMLYNNIRNKFDNVDTIYNIYVKYMFAKLKLYNITGYNIKFYILCTPKTYFNSKLIIDLFKKYELDKYIIIKECGNLHELIEKSFQDAEIKFLKIVNNIIKKYKDMKIIFIPMCTHYFFLNSTFQKSFKNHNLYKYFIM